MICGVTTSLSPFGIFVSPLKVAGFYSPVSQLPGAINTVKGGSTVPLKFNVYVDGVEKTDTSVLQFGMWAVACASSTAEDPVDFTTTGGTELRYSGGSFVQNWKTPNARLLPGPDDDDRRRAVAQRAVQREVRLFGSIQLERE